MEFCIPVPVLCFHFLGLDSIIVWSAHTLQSYLFPHSLSEGSLLSSSGGFSELFKNPLGYSQSRKRWSVQFPHPKGKSPIICCCFSLPHGGVLDTGPHLVTSGANPLLSMLSGQRSPVSTQLSQGSPLEFAEQSSSYSTLSAPCSAIFLMPGGLGSSGSGSVQTLATYQTQNL